MKDLITSKSDVEEALEAISRHWENVPVDDRDEFLNASLMVWADRDPDKLIIPINLKMPVVQ